MEGTAVHPNEALRDFIANSARMQAHMIAFWLEKTDPSKLDWTPGEPGVSKARTILDQVSELVNVLRRQAAALRGEPTESLEKITVTAEDAGAQLVSAANEAATALLATPAEKLDEEIDSFLGRRPLVQILMISMIFNMSYHGGVINAYQLMYGDETFHIPPTL